MAVCTPSPNPNPSRIPRESISAAVAALLEWIQSQPKHQKAQLFEHDDLLYLSLALTKIPSKSRVNPYRIPIPHPLHPFDPQSTSICLLLDDRPSSPLPPAAAMDQIRARALPISSVIGLSELESDYKPYESRRKLCDSYDLFFADRKILPLLPRLLGKHFFKRKKIPLAVDSSRVGWPEQVKSWCESSLLYLRSGSCSMLKIGRVNMTKDEIVENAVAAVEGAMGSVLKKWGNLRSLHVKTAESLALPVYQAVPEIGMKIEGVWDEGKGGSFVEGKKRGRDEERKGKKEKKRRIHDTGALDEDGGDALDVDGGDEEVLGVEKIAKKKLKDEVEGEKKRKKRKKDDVSNDKEEEQANDELGVVKGMKETGKHEGSELSENKLKKKKKKKMAEDAVMTSVGAKKTKPNKKGADELVLNDELGVEKGMKKTGKHAEGSELSEHKIKKTMKKKMAEDAVMTSVGTKCKPNKKGADELVLNDELGVENGMKKTGKHAEGSELSEHKIKKMKKKKMAEDAVMTSVGTKKSKPNKKGADEFVLNDGLGVEKGMKKSKPNKKGADEFVLNDELGVEKGMKKSKPNKKGADELVLNDELIVEKGMKKKVNKAVKGKGVGDDEDVGMENVGSVSSEKRVKKTKTVEGDEVVASGGTRKNKPKNRRVKV